MLLQAGKAIDLREARDVHSESYELSEKKSGFAGSFMGMPIPTSAAARNATTRASNTAVASTIDSAYGGVLMQAGQIVNLQGVQVTAGGDINIRGTAVAIAGAVDYSSTSSEHSSKGTNIGMTGWHDPGKGINARTADTLGSQDGALVRSTLEGANVNIQASSVDGVGGMLALSGTRINTPGTLTLEADTLVLATQTTQANRSETHHGNDLAWQKAKGAGTSDETTHYNQFNVGALARPVGQIQAGLSARDSIDALAQQPGMGWVQQLQQDPQLSGKVDWQQVQEAHQTWDYKQKG